MKGRVRGWEGKREREEEWEGNGYDLVLSPVLSRGRRGEGTPVLGSRCFLRGWRWRGCRRYPSQVLR